MDTCSLRPATAGTGILGVVFARPATAGTGANGLTYIIIVWSMRNPGYPVHNFTMSRNSFCPLAPAIA